MLFLIGVGGIFNFGEIVFCYCVVCKKYLIGVL